MSNVGVIILAAGKGTRMKSEKPKVCFNLAGKSLIQRVVESSIKFDATKIAVVVGFKKEIVINSLEKHPSLYFVEQVTQNGTGDAVKCAKEIFSDFYGVVFILCGDVPLLKTETLLEMYDKYMKTQSTCVVLTMHLDNPDRYGRIIRDEDGQVKQIVEYKDASDMIREINEINTGIYCFSAKDLFHAIEQIDNKNEQNEYYLTDVLKILYDENKKIESVVLSDINEAIGINSQIQLAELESEHYKTVREKWMNNGVSIENPETVLITEDVTIGSDVYISANTKISGKSHIKANTYIGPNCVIENSILEKGSYLHGMNVVVNSFDLQLKLWWYDNSIVQL
jgi:UDP-N-acetylglucosamine diphosphorylase/glucosamine-1-phosphate N-acetyltransferase